MYYGGFENRELEVFTVMMTSVLFKSKLFTESRRESPRGLVVEQRSLDRASSNKRFLPCLFPSFSFIIIIFLSQSS